MRSLEEVRCPNYMDYNIMKRLIEDITGTPKEKAKEYVNSIKTIKEAPVIAYTRRIYFLKFETKAVGLLIVSKDLIDPKIEFMAIEKAYRKFGGGTDMLEKAFKLLGTTKPVIEIPIDRYLDFRSFIERYEWYTSTFYVKNKTRVFVMNKF